MPPHQHRVKRRKRPSMKRLRSGQERHAIQAAKDRFGFDVTRNEYEALTAAIGRGEYSHQAICRLSAGRTAYAIFINDQMGVAVYSKGSRRIVTFLTEEMVRRSINHKGISLNEDAFVEAVMDFRNYVPAVGSRRERGDHQRIKPG